MMKKILAAVLALALLCGSMAALAEGNGTVTVEVNTEKLPVYAAEDPYAAAFLTETQQAGGLPVLLIAEGKSQQLQALAQGAVRNRRVVLSAEDGETVRVHGNTVTGLKAGNTVLTIASEEDPSAMVQYLAVVYRPVSRITVTAQERSVAVGQTLALTAVFEPEDAALKQAEWSVADGRIASVDENGVVTGLNRGNVWVTAKALDGSNVRANFTVQVIQNAEEITLDKTELTVDTGRSAHLAATVLPKNTNDRNVVWTSSDEGIAKVNAYGQVTGVTPGTCEIVCAAAGNENVQAKATVHVQRPVSRITFGDAPRVYLNETGKLQWTIEPADATHQEITFTSGNEAVLTVAEDGTVTGHSLGGAYITAIATDGSYRKAQQKVNVLQHLQSVKMARKTAYIDIGETAVAGAVLKPDKYINRSMTWETDDASVATVKAATGRTDRVKIHGVAKGTTTVTGTTEDGGLQASIKVKIGNYSRLAKIKDAYINGKGRIVLKVQNVSADLDLTYVMAEIEAFDSKGKPVKINEKNGSNKITAVYGRTLVPGAVTKADKWKFRDLNPEAVFHQMTVRITEYQINGDWVKTLRSHLRPVYKYKPKKKEP